MTAFAVFGVWLFACYLLALWMDRRSVAVLALVVLSSACAGAAPTTPTPVSKPVISTDPRFDMAFYAGFATGRPPKSFTVYVAETDDKKQPVPALTVEQAKQAAASLQSALGLPVDVRSMAGATSADVFRGLAVNWLDSDPIAPGVGGFALPYLTGAVFIYYRAATFEVCGGLAQTVVRHELLHAMGFAHTDDPGEVMYRELRYCDLLPSPREQFHVRLALGLS